MSNKDFKNKERARIALKELEKYSKELNKFAFLIFGSALTIYRDNFHDDDDIDFALFEKDTLMLLNFLEKHNFKIFRLFTFKNKICEITIIFEDVHIDFFIIGDFGQKKSYTYFKEWQFFGTKATEIFSKKIMINSNTKFKKKIFNILWDEEWFKNRYGNSWNIKIIGTQYRNMDKDLFQESVEKGETIFYNKNIAKNIGRVFRRKKAKIEMLNFINKLKG